MRLASSISLMVVAALLLFSGLVHAAQPYYFVHTIASYRLLPAWAGGLMGLWLPYLQIVIAVCLGLGMARRGALYASIVLFAMFAFAQFAVLVRGLEIDCGCFGFVVRPVSPMSATLPVVLLGACIIDLLQEARAGRRNYG